jgi:hypothetical protein
MTPRTLPNDIALPELRAQIGFTGRRLRAHPLTQAFAPKFEKLLTDWPLVHQTELELTDKVDEAIIGTNAADEELNLYAQRVSVGLTLLIGNDRTHPLYAHFFGNTPLHVFTRPKLGEQLTSMRAWISSLQKSEHASLNALGAELPALIEKADKAVTARANAETAQQAFRAIGERKALIDDVNAARKETYGALATLPHKHTGLPARFADGFFRRERAKDHGEPDLEAVEEAIEALKKELAAQEKAREELLVAEAQAKAAADAEAKAAAEAKLAALQKEIELKQKEVAAIQAAMQPAGP